MVNDYNQLQDTFAANANVLKPSIRDHFDSKLYSYYFDHTGITKSSFGKLQLNEKDLEQQLKTYYQETIHSIEYLAENVIKSSNDLSKMTGEMLLQKHSFQPLTQYSNFNSSYMPYINPQYMQSPPHFWMAGMMFMGIFNVIKDR